MTELCVKKSFTVCVHIAKTITDVAYSIKYNYVTQHSIMGNSLVQLQSISHHMIISNSLSSTDKHSENSNIHFIVWHASLKTWVSCKTYILHNITGLTTQI